MLGAAVLRRDGAIEVLGPERRLDEGALGLGVDAVRRRVGAAAFGPGLREEGADLSAKTIVLGAVFEVHV